MCHHEIISVNLSNGIRQFLHHFTEQNKFHFTEHFEQIRVVSLGSLRVLDLQSDGLESTGLFTGFLLSSPEFNSTAMLVKCYVLLLASWDSYMLRNFQII